MKTNNFSDFFKMIIFRKRIEPSYKANQKRPLLKRTKNFIRTTSNIVDTSRKLVRQKRNYAFDMNNLLW
ncbi:hypothetical protein DDB_G0271800 [Dictyostelium discoideum AX4]|uniref:Uncharacterized protein n=1 Tax=Dictyostelium discoideum TaxID=44689 RepID=Q55AP5_DICDI|nr:hypothetical protein DDB_G0271800 [Dictyostelium discoideum AX4]EAL71590.1 hypothetical protein DDB_G0271800 [Dictyostelium discoideum AX4]|eukprot:XP_645477.1 hypothetical protein DDB_G0271800 [Dictyostelium discoideum AX4]